MKLSSKQEELLSAMRAGVVVHYMDGLDMYYFRSDTMGHCTATVEALIKRGLAELYAGDWRGAKVRAVETLNPPIASATPPDASAT